MADAALSLANLGWHVFPITRVFKRFKNGVEDDLLSLYAALRQKLAPGGLERVQALL